MKLREQSSYCAFLQALAVILTYSLVVSPISFAQSVSTTTGGSTGGTAGASPVSLGASPSVMDAAGLTGAGDLFVAPGSTTVIDFANSNSLVLNGNLTNNGTIIFASSNPAITSASLSASSILNQQGATLSSLLSPALLPSLNGYVPISNLTLNSATNIVNYGTISAAGNLNLNAVQQVINNGTISAQGSMAISAASIVNTALITAMQNVNLQAANIVNSGQMNSALANINIASGIVQNIIVNNTGGVLQALNGAVTLRDALYSGTGELQITGGSIVSQVLNLNNGNGNISASLDSITGTVNATGSCATLGVADQNLRLGNLLMTGDPTYFNNAGSITIDGNIQVGFALAVLAAGDITTTNNVNLNLISTTDGAGQGHNIYFVAGANITSGTGTTNTINQTPPIAGNATSNVTISGAGGGGNIDFSASPNLTISSASTCAGCSGGNIVLAAYSNGANGGRVIMPSLSPTVSGVKLNSSSVSGNAGNITVIAGAANGSNIQLGQMTASGAGAIGTGLVQITTAQPTSSNGLPIVFGFSNLFLPNSEGEIISNNSFIPSANLNDVSVGLNDNIVANSISINAGNGITSVDAIVSQIVAGGTLLGTAINPAGTFVYTVDSPGNRLLAINTATNSISAIVNLNGSPSAVAVSPDGSKIYVADSLSNQIEVIDAASLTISAVIPSAGAAPSAIAFNADGSRVYVSNLASNNVGVYNTSTNTLAGVIPLNGAPIDIVFNKADSTLYVATTGGGGSIYSLDTLTSATNTIALPGTPSGIGLCPCGTKLYVPTPTTGEIQEISLVNAPTSPIAITPGAALDGIAIAPDGAYAYFLDRNANTSSVITTLNSTIKSSFAVPVNGGVRGNFAGFAGNNPVAYIPNGGQLAVLRTPALIAPSISLNSQNSAINVATGASSNLSTNSGSYTVVTSNANLVSSGATAGGALQYATTNNITFNGNATGSILDFHAINGTFTIGANSTVQATDTVALIASPNIVVNGVLQTTNGGGLGDINLQSPTGQLQVSLGTGSQISTLNSAAGNINLNIAQGTSINVTGSGTLATDCVQGNGNPGKYSVNINVQQIDGMYESLLVDNKPNAVTLITQTGDLQLCDVLDTSAMNGSGGPIYLQAFGGAILSQGGLVSDGDGIGNKAGDITAIASGGIGILGPVTAKGTNGANAGNISLISPGQPIEVDNFFTSDGISATADGTANGGNINIISDSLVVAGLNSNNASIDASSNFGRGGTINITNTSITDPFAVGGGCGCNTTAGAIVSTGLTGGRINLNVASGLDVLSGAGIVADGDSGGQINLSVPSLFVDSGSQISAMGAGGSGGVVQVLGSPFGVLNVNNDGAITAASLSSSTGRVGFNTFGTGGLSLTGNGALFGGEMVAFGNLDPATAYPINPLFFPATNNFLFGNISAQQGFPIGTIIAVGRPLPPGPNSSTSNTALVSAPSIQIQTPGSLANTTIIPTDQTPEARQTTVRRGIVPTDERKGRDLDDSISAALAFDADSQSLVEQGVRASVGPKPDSVFIEDGNVVFLARKPIELISKFGEIQINPGNIVFVMANSQGISAYNLHDDLTSSPLAIAGYKSVKFSLGNEVLIKRSGNSGFNSKIAYRQPEVLLRQSGFEIHSAQFSLPSAMNAIRTLKTMRHSDQADARKAIDQIMKNAAIFSVVGSRFGPYMRQSQPK